MKLKEKNYVIIAAILGIIISLILFIGILLILNNNPKQEQNIEYNNYQSYMGYDEFPLPTVKLLEDNEANSFCLSYIQNNDQNKNWINCTQYDRQDFIQDWEGSYREGYRVWIFCRCGYNITK